jgi:hypothetical protein
MLAPSLVSILVLALLGCEGSTPPMPPVMTLDLQLGTVDLRKNGDTRWVDLTDDQQVELAPGAQGGFHVWLLYRIGENDQPRKLRIERIADRIGDGEIRQRVLTTSNNIEVPAMPLWELPAPVPSFMCPTPIGVNVIDAPLELLVRVSDDASGTELAEKSVRIFPGCPPDGDAQRDFCLRICQG